MDLLRLDASNGFRLDGVAVDDYSGNSVSGTGDINGDGVDDLLVGAFYADSNGINSDSNYVMFGKITGFYATINLSSLDGDNGFRLEGVRTNDALGWLINTAGDVNGDGLDDLIVGIRPADSNVTSDISYKSL